MIDSTYLKFSDKDPGEIVILAFNFGDLGIATISSSSVTVKRVGGTADGNPGAMVTGGATAIGSIVYQRVINGVLGADYHLKAEANLSDGQKLFLVGELCIRKASPRAS